MALPFTRALLWALLLLAPMGLTACAADSAKTAVGCSNATTPCLSGKALVALQTSRGEIQVSLIGDAAPLTAGNFVDLVRRGTYNNTVFHRVVTEPSPFVVQGGDPQSADPKVPASLYGSGGFIDTSTGAPRTIPLEIGLKGEADPRYGEELLDPTQLGRLRLLHDRGAIAMARSADPNSASAQFYIALRPLVELDGRYAVFGRVVKGMEVVDRIKQGDRLIKAVLLEGGTLVKAKP
ncbi:peptidylprolyl isomerase [Synechococcus sp. CS-1324]|uniref:peptidylprolyl isomerase n=1 Tax=Synechococcus sp. CS-1324 TaxID=2847980 RepID=UPI000DB75FEA|nr:peptidylprolyl isomerase [Synechococcus sp. CS-1324]MCT0229642.1 peptidylprolyl isomerase [Synechococcus sp. CS-1324]PZV05970.1 MAG: peptidylprolyl isomerase [Cyanobium sp.]